MRKSLLAALAAAILVSPGAPASKAQAQNTICPTAKNGDNTNKCASTAFVQNAFGGASSLALPNGKFFIGNVSNLAAAQSLSGDCTATNAGVITCTKTNGTAFGVFATASAASATAALNQFTSTLQGIVPGSGGGTTNFLRADGSWAPPVAAGVSSYNGLTGAVAASSADKRIYVSTSGNDANNGLSPESAKLTLQACVTAANAGGICEAGAGTYTLAATLNMQPGVTLHCPYGATITQGSAANLPYLIDFNVNSANNGVLDGCTVDGNRTNNTLNTGAANINIGAASSVVIRNSTIQNSRGDGILIGTGITYSISRNTFSNNYYASIYAAAHASTGIGGEIASNYFTLIGAHAITQSGGNYNRIHDNHIVGTLNNGGFTVTVSGTTVTANTSVFSATCDGAHVCPGNFIIAGGSGVYQELFIVSVSSGTVATASAAGTSVTAAAAIGGTGDLIDIAYNANANRIYNNTLIFGAGGGLVDADIDDSNNSASHNFNQYSGNYISTIGGNCIAVEQTNAANSLFDLSIRDNYMLNCLSGGSGIYAVGETAPAAIWISAVTTANLSNVWLTGNSYFDQNNAAPYWLSGLNLATGAIHGGKNLTLGAVNGTTVGGVSASLGTVGVVP